MLLHQLSQVERDLAELLELGAIRRWERVDEYAHRDAKGRNVMPAGFSVDLGGCLQRLTVTEVGEFAANARALAADVPRNVAEGKQAA